MQVDGKNPGLEGMGSSSCSSTVSMTLVFNLPCSRLPQSFCLGACFCSSPGNAMISHLLNYTVCGSLMVVVGHHPYLLVPLHHTVLLLFVPVCFPPVWALLKGKNQSDSTVCPVPGPASVFSGFLWNDWIQPGGSSSLFHEL